MQSFTPTVVRAPELSRVVIPVEPHWLDGARSVYAFLDHPVLCCWRALQRAVQR